MSWRVVLVDPRPLAREAISTALTMDRDVEVAAACSDLPSGLLQARRTGCEVVVITAALVCDLAAACSQVAAIDPRPRTLLLDRTRDEATLRLAIEAGADGYVAGEDGLDGLLDAIRGCARGETVVPAAMLGPLLRGLIERDRERQEADDRWERLTPREREVLALIVAGHGSTAIAEALVIGTETARTHVQRVLRKLEVHSRAEAIAVAARTGLAERLAQHAATS